MTTPHSDRRPFLTVLTWPEGSDRELLAQLLADAGVLDFTTLKMRLGQAPPTIIGQVEPEAAAAAVHALVGHGGDGFAPTLDDLAALGQTFKIKDVRIVHGALKLDLWRNPGTSLPRDQVQILVRAQLTKTTTRRAPSPIPGARGVGMDRAGLGFPMMAGGAAGLALSFGRGYAANARDAVVRSIQTSDKLDIHTKDGKVYQIDGDKFGFQVLGDLRAHTDKANMDQMCELLSHIAPDEIVDPYFSLWKPPAGHHRLRLPEMRRNNEDPAFAFYSRWAALMYRYLMGKARQ